LQSAQKTLRINGFYGVVATGRELSEVAGANWPNLLVNASNL